MLVKMRAGTRVRSANPSSKPAVVHNAPYAVHLMRSVDHLPTHTLTSPTGVRTTTTGGTKSQLCYILIAKRDIISFWSQWRKIVLMLYHSTRNVHKQCSLWIKIITRQGQAVAIWTNTHHQIFAYIIRTSCYQITTYLARISVWTCFPWHTNAWSCICGYRTSRQVLVILYISMLLISVYEIIS